MGFLLLNTEVCLKKGQGFESFGGTSLSNCPLFKITPSPGREAIVSLSGLILEKKEC